MTKTWSDKLPNELNSPASVGALLKGKNAVITGCRRGIGRATLELFARNGADMWACIREPDAKFSEYIDSLTSEYSVRITLICFDLKNTEQVKMGTKEILSSKIPVDVLVNNAGAISTSLFQLTPIEKIKELFEVNYFNQLLLTQTLTRIMARQQTGSVINISSSAAIDGNEGRIAYAATKASLISSTKVMARELSSSGIRVNAIAPGLTNTEMLTNSTSDHVVKDIVSNLCLQRLGKPEEIANAILFFASDLSSYITGQVLRVDGGM